MRYYRVHFQRDIQNIHSDYSNVEYNFKSVKKARAKLKKLLGLALDDVHFFGKDHCRFYNSIYGLCDLSIRKVHIKFEK